MFLAATCDIAHSIMDTINLTYYGLGISPVSAYALTMNDPSADIALFTLSLNKYCIVIRINQWNVFDYFNNTLE